MTCAISVGGKRDVDHIVGFLFQRVGKKRRAVGVVCGWEPRPRAVGVRIRHPGLVPEKRNEAGAACVVLTPRGLRALLAREEQR